MTEPATNLDLDRLLELVGYGEPLSEDEAEERDLLELRIRAALAELRRLRSLFGEEDARASGEVIALDRSTLAERVVHSTVRESIDEEWIDIECRFANGEKFVAVQVTADRPGLAYRVAAALRTHE